VENIFVKNLLFAFQFVGHKQRNSTARVNSDMGTMNYYYFLLVVFGLFVTRALRIKGVVVETSKKANPIEN